MNDIQILVSFLQNYGIDVVILGVLVCVLTSFVKKFVPKSLKNFIGLIPFLLGVLLYALYSLLLLKNSLCFEIVNKGIQTGAIATLIYAFSKQLKLSGGDIIKSISDLLTGILSSKTISEVVKVIKENFSHDITDEEKVEKITEILKQNQDVPDDVKEVVVKLILQTLTEKKK